MDRTKDRRTKEGRRVHRSGAAFLKLHELLRAGEINEATFRVGLEHVALAGDDGVHYASRATLAQLCSSAQRAMHETQVERCNNALVRLGFMTMDRRQLPNGAFRSNEYRL